MRSVSQKFINASLSPVGYATAYIQIGSTTIDASNITEISIASNLGGGAFTIGGFDTTEATITVVSDALPNVITAQPISVYFGYYVNNGNVAYEYVPMGVFYAEPRDVTHKNLLTTIKAHDRSWAMTDPYTTSLNFSGNVKVSQVLSEIATALSLTMGSYGGLAPANVRVYEAPQGSYRDVIAQMALLMGTNAKLNRTGALDFIKINPSASPVQEYGAYDYNAENYELTSDAPMAFGVLTVNYTHEVATGSGEDQETEEVTDTYTYSAPTGSHGLTIDTINIRSQAETNTLGASVLGNGVSYYGYTATLPGQPQIDLGDVIRIEEPLGDEYNFVVLSATHVFNGAMSSTFTAVIEDEDPAVENNNVSGSLTEQVTTISNALGRQTRLLADTIAANTAEFNNIEANYAHITNGVIDNATIGYADVNGLNANYAHITSGVIDNATIGYADVNGLNANYAHITSGVIDNAHISYASVDNLSTNYAQINGANITNITAQNGWIDKLMVQTDLLSQSGTVYTLDAIQVNASNITAGTLDVRRLILTVNGHKYLFDPTGQYSKTTDTSVVSGKTYYTVVGTAVGSPTVANIDSYYEKENNVYYKTIDTEIKSGKTYYTLNATQVTNPKTAQIGTYYELVTYEKLHGDAILDDTITASKIVAEAITAEKITTQNIVGTGGWINLRNGTFNYVNAQNGNGITWDGTNLTIKGSVTVTGGNTYTKTEVDTAVSDSTYAVQIEVTAISYESNTAILKARVFKEGVELTSAQYSSLTIGYAWTKDHSSSVGTNSQTLSVTDLNAVYTCTCTVS